MHEITTRYMNNSGNYSLHGSIGKETTGNERWTNVPWKFFLRWKEDKKLRWRALFTLSELREALLEVETQDEALLNLLRKAELKLSSLEQAKAVV